MRGFHLWAVAVVAVAAGGVCAASDLRLAAAGATGYRIVRPAAPSKADEYAVKLLADCLKQTTAAAFPVVAPEALGAGQRAIFVGLSGPVLQALGERPLDGLADQQYVCRSVGDNVYLYGNGLRGNLDAVVDFVENTLGRRWYSGRLISETPPRWTNGLGQPVFRPQRELSVRPFSRKGGFSFAYRIPSYEWMFDFHLQSGMNMFSSERVDPTAFSLKVVPVHCHTLFGYIPPSPREQPWAKIFDWVDKKDYFTSHPEFFGLTPAGRRHLEYQLCLSNPELRRQLTANVLEHIRRLKASGHQRLMLNVSAMDTVPQFCFCRGCQGLKKKYDGPGGPLYDYLFELCAVLKGRHPDTMIHTLAYRHSQTQKPPAMPAGTAFPENLVIQFADVEDNVDVDWTHAVNRASYQDLLAWGKLTRHLWTWYYSNGMLERMVADIRLMKAAGVEGVYVEFGGGDYNAALNFSELQIYVYNKLLRNVDADVPALVREFTDYQYGPAAEGARNYLREMEAAWRASSTITTLSAGRGLGRRLVGVSAETMRRWQEAFDRMEGLTARDARLSSNVRRLRRGLDYRTLAEWNTLSKACPAYFGDHRVIKNRLGVLPHWSVAMVDDWEILIKTAGMEKRLPAPFDALDKALVRRFVPAQGRGNPKLLVDAAAAFGYAAVVNLPNRPLTFGFYQEDTRKFGARGSVGPAEISMGAFRVYRLGEITVTPNCRIWFSGSWETKLELGERLYRPPSPDNDNRYEAYVSLKFDKPIPPTPRELAENDKWSLDRNAPYSVLCDQVILVKK